MNGFKKIFKGKKILVTGGTGSIGSEIVRQLLNYEPEQIRIFSRDDSKQFDLQQSLGITKKNNDVLRFLIGDIRDKDRLDRAFKDIDIVFHAAALKHVSFCEYNPFEAIKTNVSGAQNVLDLAIDHHVERVIAISSDKAVYPQTILGITKLLMERMVVSATNYAGAPEIKFSVVRFGNVINSRGSVIPLWISQIKKGGPVTVTHKDMERYFMSTADAVNLVFMAAQMMLGSEIFVLKMPKYKIHDLAVEIIKRHGDGKKIDIEFIGIREKEKIDEKLFTDEEAELMIDAGVFNIIQSNEETFLKRRLLYKVTESPKFTTQADILSSF